ncbi:unnamed protein product, partial [marine sediment metagenome]
IGIGVMVGSISLTFIFTPLFILVNIWELKEIEEPELGRRLGEEYIEYRTLKMDVKFNFWHKMYKILNCHVYPCCLFGYPQR